MELSKDKKGVLNLISNKYIQAAKSGYIIVSVLLCMLGAALIADPTFSVLLLCRLSGLLLVLFGAIRIVGYVSKDLYRLAFQYDLAFGILLIALGALMMLRTDKMANVLFSILGIYVLADALLKVQIAIDAKAFGIDSWWLILAAAVVAGVAGFLLVLRLSESAGDDLTGSGTAGGGRAELYHDSGGSQNCPPPWAGCVICGDSPL